MNYQFKQKMHSDLREVSYVIKKLLDCLNMFIVDKSLLFDLRLIINELVINGCEHGNRFARDKQVDLRVTIQDDQIIIEVEDEGSGLSRMPGNPELHELSCNGRGLYIVQRLSDELILDNNKITAVIRIGKNPSPYQEGIFHSLQQ